MSNIESIITLMFRMIDCDVLNALGNKLFVELNRIIFSRLNIILVKYKTVSYDNNNRYNVAYKIIAVILMACI